MKFGKSAFLGNSLLIFVAAIWGTSFGLQAAAMQGIGPMLFTGLRFFIAAVLIIPFASREGKISKLKATDIKACLPVGVALFSAIALQQVSLLFTTVSNAGFLTALYVVLTPFASRFLFGVNVSRSAWMAAGVACLGASLVAGSAGSLGWGDALVIMSSMAWALQIIMLERSLRLFPRPVTVSMIQFFAVALLSSTAAGMLEVIDVRAIEHVWPYILFCSVVSVGLGYTLQSVGQRYTTANAAAIILSTEAVFAALFGYFFLNERMNAVAILGAVLVMAAVIAIQIRPESVSVQEVNYKGD